MPEPFLICSGVGTRQGMRLHNWLFAVHQDVRFDAKQLLRDKREQNTDRVLQGLRALGGPLPARLMLQGSMAMHTMVRRDVGDVDVDVGLVFSNAGLPRSPLAARRLVHEAAVVAAPAGFASPPSCRGNAVTVWYSRGYHVDFAVYRETPSGELEHAGFDWTLSDPQGLQRWFSDRVNARSPAFHKTGVQDGQLRRMVRLVKWAFRSSAGDFPGGYLLTLLVADAYQPSEGGDDESLLRTLRVLQRMLQNSLALVDPVTGVPVGRRRKDIRRLRRLSSDLDARLESFQGLTGRASLARWKAAWMEMLRYPK